MKRVVTDLAIIGAGAAGIPAAITGIDRGLTVDVFDQDSRSGGGCDGGNGVFAVGTPLQKEKQLPYTTKEIFDYWMEYTHYRVDGRLVSEFINRSADTVAWLESYGAVLDDLIAYYPGAYFVWHFRKEGSPKILDLLRPASDELGVNYHLNTVVESLIMEEGRCCGFRARMNGEEMEVRARAVLVATGGIGKSPALVKEHTGYEIGRDLSVFPGMMYENEKERPKSGVELAWEAGAKHAPFTVDAYASIPAPNFGPGGCPPQLGDFRQPYNILVNYNGERFVNEAALKNGAFVGNAIINQPEQTAFMIFDSTLREYYDTHGWEYRMPNVHYMDNLTFDEYIEMNTKRGNRDICVADSVEELCDVMGIDQRLVGTVEEYNRNLLEEDGDPLFFKEGRFLRVLKGPKFYCAKFKRQLYGVLGGLKINYKTEVLDDFLRPIAGLYAAGNDANTIYSDTYPFALSGNSSSFAINSGRMAGEYAAAYIGAV